MTPGCHCVIPCADSVSGFISMRTQQLVLQVETKTRDSVFCKIAVSVQYRVQPESVEKAFYSLQNPHGQIASFVENTIRSRVADIDLDALFTSKDEIAHAVDHAIDERMKTYGYEILTVLVTDIDPDANVKRAMNQIVENKRLQTAAEFKGEAEKTLQVKQAEARKAAAILDAEADAAAKRLAGEGVAAQREAIINGLRESVHNFSEAVGVDASEAMTYVLTLTHYDTLKDIAHGSNTSTLFTPYGPGAISGLSEQIRDSMLQAKMVPGTDSGPVKRSGGKGSKKGEPDPDM